MRVGAVILTLLALIAIFADVIATHEATRLNPAIRLQAPSGEHYFGTDNLGRDVFSMTLAGARLSLFIGATVVAVSIPLGTAIGLVSGYFPRADTVIMRIVDGLSAFPSLVFALALMAALGASVMNVIIALTVTYLPRTARIARGSTLAIRGLMYIDAEKAIGSSAIRVMAFHILPNIMAPLLVLASFTFATAILVEAGLSFLGAGVGADVPSWGRMISDAREYINTRGYLMVFPGVAIAITVLGLNLLGDGLRDVLDPRLRGQFRGGVD